MSVVIEKSNNPNFIQVMDNATNNRKIKDGIYVKLLLALSYYSIYLLSTGCAQNFTSMKTIEKNNQRTTPNRITNATYANRIQMMEKAIQEETAIATIVQEWSEDIAQSTDHHVELFLSNEWASVVNKRSAIKETVNNLLRQGQGTKRYINQIQTLNDFLQTIKNIKPLLANIRISLQDQNQRNQLIMEIQASIEEELNRSSYNQQEDNVKASIITRFVQEKIAIGSNALKTIDSNLDKINEACTSIHHDFECCICWELLLSSLKDLRIELPIQRGSCGHCFHAACIYNFIHTMLQENQKLILPAQAHKLYTPQCPICNTKISDDTMRSITWAAGKK